MKILAYTLYDYILQVLNRLLIKPKGNIYLPFWLREKYISLFNGQHSFPSFLKEDILDSGENHFSLNFTLTFNIAPNLIKHITGTVKNKLRLFRISWVNLEVKKKYSVFCSWFIWEIFLSKCISTHTTYKIAPYRQPRTQRSNRNFLGVLPISRLNFHCDIPWNREENDNHPVFLPGEFLGQRSLAS